MSLEAKEIYCPRCGGRIPPPKIVCEYCFADRPKPRVRAVKPKPDDPSGLLEGVPEIQGLDKPKTGISRLPGGQYGA